MNKKRKNKAKGRKGAREEMERKEMKIGKEENNLGKGKKGRKRVVSDTETSKVLKERLKKDNKKNGEEIEMRKE